MSDIQDTSYEIKVYKIWYDDEPENFYIGSTKYRQLAKRMAYHRGKVKLGNTSKLYTAIREKGINNFNYIQIASCMVNNFDEQRMFEQEYLDLLKPTLNMIRAFTSEEVIKEYQQLYFQIPENKEKQKSYNKAYYKAYKQIPEYKEKIKEYSKRYRQIPENKEKIKAYQQTQEYKEKKKKINKNYKQKKKYEKIDEVFQKFKEHFNIP
jgi:hypothetical protein